MEKLGLVILLGFTLISIGHAWPYGQQTVRGVNLGSWLVLEKWISPAPFKGTDAVDEWQLCQKLGSQEAQKRLKAHWDSWVTEDDIIQLKQSGINHLRIPVGYWALEIPQGEPWVSGSWNYVMKACGWAKKHGLQVMIVLHGAPGSQNGKDHSGHSGEIKFYYDDKNLALATRVLGKMAKTFNATEWRQTVSIIEVLNEPILWDDYNYRLNRLKQFYRQAYDEIRKYNDIVVVDFHDAFISHNNWYYLHDDSHYSKIMLDAHYYQVFGDEWQNKTCDEQAYASSRYCQSLPQDNQKIWTVVGEWSLATPKPCRSTIKTMAMQQMGVYERASGWIFWNFKNGQGWDEWDFMSAVKNGWINLNQKIAAKC